MPAKREVAKEYKEELSKQFLDTTERIEKCWRL